MKLNVQKKLFGGFAIVLLILAAMVTISFTEVNSIDRTYSSLIDERAKKLISIKDLKILVKKEQVHLRGFALFGDEKNESEFYKASEEFIRKIEKLEQDASPTEKKLLNELINIEREYFAYVERVMELKKAENPKYLDYVNTKGPVIVSSFEAKSDELVNYMQGVLDEANKKASNQVQGVKTLVLVLGIISVLVGMIVALWIGRIISKPVKTIAAAADKIAAGDLSNEPVVVKNKDEIGDLASSFNLMVKNLRELIQEVNSNADQVAASSEQLTASAEQTSKATEQISCTMQEVATGVDRQVEATEESTQTINEMSIGINQIAQNAQQVSSTALEASEKALAGGKTISNAVGQMNAINTTVTGLGHVVKGLGEKSKEIGQIIEVITGIASQTNLLALNAAIEAARAGDQGRGFAVVADEVRKLAEQSAESASQISRLISTIQDQTQDAVSSMSVATKEVEVGIRIVDSAGETFTQIQKSIEDVTNQISEVSSAVQQMSAGGEQMVNTMQTITQIAMTSASGTQEVSAATEEQLASMEEITSSANALSHMAEDLQQLIGKFKL